ncbi:SDR family NAD(P)-dependent oxidoreductase [Marinicella litoralis]|uniref:NAD(P)-dependent dehydrogenase (Short-subunit alcohol dehydrogenase family) n=1 Tax=Marinicella litoralis TaxID=644220 RepID=A0A4R6XG96_9GAMM|nr:SDR family NAD(P)-dependent oxidoreductase [Marinicella litoralis]TDR18402.1 NAD(P)-dependent dehydrogenase (short-subunit alcohol dehydrogenase family) [Marinicella litoralis]
MNLKQTKAIITGGASGLGFACAEYIVKKGGQVTLFDINQQAGDEAVNKLGHQHACFVQADVSNETDIQTACDRAKEFMGFINVAINCAGVLAGGRVLGREEPMALSHFNKAIQVNLVGSFNVSKAAAYLMQNNEADSDGQRGVIINTASVAAFEGQIGQAAYSASKGGIVGMTLPMAREFTRFGIRVMTIAPGVFLTPMVAGLPDDIKAALGASVPFPSRLGQPEEFARMAEHIIENTYLNGSTIRLDGAVRLEPK